MSNEHHYIVVGNNGPLIVVRVPLPMPRWRNVLRAFTGLMRTHGMRQKDIVFIEGLVSDRPEERTDEERKLAQSFDAKTGLAAFHLYVWRDDGAFQLYRTPIKGSRS